MTGYRDRQEAGLRLAAALEAYAGRRDAVVLALPRGGVPVGFEVAQRLGLPLDIFLVRKLGWPGHEELAIGAVTANGTHSFNLDLVASLGASAETLEAMVAAEEAELERRARLWRGERPRPSARGQVVILVDDGLATGATMRAAAESLRREQPAELVAAVPVGSASACEKLAPLVDRLVCPLVPPALVSISQWYDDFSQVSDAEVQRLLCAARSSVRPGRDREPSAPTGEATPVRLAVDGGAIEGELVLPPFPRALVLFAHGSGSSRLSPRNRAVAHTLHQRHLGTLLFDLLTAAEASSDEVTGRWRFDIDLLAGRLLRVTEHVSERPDLQKLRLGYFGASNGAAAALVAAASPHHEIGAVVSRGGRPDLAGTKLLEVRAPTLLIVGGRDSEVLKLNSSAMLRMTCERQLEVVEGAGHLFEEPGALERVAGLATAWFERYLAR
jgi:putative phosphoribosyl transferase